MHEEVMTFLAKVHQSICHNQALTILASTFGSSDAGLREELAHCGVLTIELDREAEIWIGVDRHERPSTSASSLKIIVVLEPPDVREFCLDGFDYVLTFRDDQLQSLPNAFVFLPATPWLLPDEWASFGDQVKSKSLGFLKGSKTKTVGHRLRGEVWNARERLESAMDLALNFEVGAGVERDVRNHQFTSQFVLVIENSRHKNYFTEKLLDALLAGCVPVYWGCPNLEEYFDVTGIVQVHGGLDELISACSRLDGALYESSQSAKARNFELAKQYAGDFGKRLQISLQECLRASG